MRNSAILFAFLLSYIFTASPAFAIDLGSGYSDCEFYRLLCIETGDPLWCDSYIEWCWLLDAPVYV